MDLSPEMREAAARLTHTPLTAIAALVDRALIELLHAELHIQLDETLNREIPAREIPAKVTDVIRGVTHQLKDCSVVLQRAMSDQRQAARLRPLAP